MTAKKDETKKDDKNTQPKKPETKKDTKKTESKKGKGNGKSGGKKKEVKEKDKPVIHPPQKPVIKTINGQKCREWFDEDTGCTYREPLDN